MKGTGEDAEAGGAARRDGPSVAPSPDGASAAAARRLYDALGRSYLATYGEHVHIGLYADRDGADRPSWGAAQRAMVGELVALAGPPPPLAGTGKLLDIGCGHGATACDLAERFGCDAVGINISPFQVAYANALAARRGLGGRARFLVADGMAPPFGAGAFGAVVSIESAAYMPDKRKFVSEIARLLAPGGRLYLSDFCAASPAPQRSRRQQAALDAVDAAFASAGAWACAEEYRRMMEACGLLVLAEADWTLRLRGFWDIGLAEALLRRDPESEAAARGRSALANLAVLFVRLLHISWLCLQPLLLHADARPLAKAVWGFVLGGDARIMRRAFGGGALMYRAFVAVKPEGGAGKPGPPPAAREVAVDVAAVRDQRPL
ncbi:gamma-tocopherol methyltransferase [Raphidocelis subcapitata]|uniref:Gamma-tocopherol methyltransferase n=1 Tax=Raphidocelis subcapitata TaxID=307507 RepID=A0A2V0PGR0_9CHLO|nr:gamma-tocopherol methyltransferase [Raphidocelis subcapitata]|eukprot:GBF97100.1 gamma-tocopherol methyltransferase [Raphidocelis subcapitata]